MTTAIDTYRNYGTARLKKFKERLTDRDGAVSVRVNVESGLHEGMSVDLEQSAFVIGSDMADDVMLLDDEVLDTTVKFNCEPSVFGPLLSLETERNDVMVNGRFYTPGDPMGPERLPCTVEIGGVALSLVDPTRRHGLLKTRLKAAALPLFATIATVAFGTQMVLMSRESSPVSIVTAASVAGSATSQASAATPTPEALIALAEEEISKSKLDEYLTVSTGNDGTLNIAGSVPAAQMSKWHVVHQQLDHIAGQAVIISKVTQASTLSGLPPVSAVQLGETPTIVFANGTKANVGDALKGGWEITEINQSSFNVKRGSEILSVDF